VGKHVFVWDVDGVIIDSVPECFDNTVIAIGKNIVEVERAIGKKFKDMTFDEFRAFRHLVVHAKEFFSVPLTLRKHDIHWSAPHFRVLHEKFQKDEEKLIKKLNDDFYAIRKESMAKNLEAWMKRNPLYKDVDKVIKLLGEHKIPQYVVSSKDKKSIEDMLKFHGIHQHFSKVYGNEDLIPPGGVKAQQDPSLQGDKTAAP
jgi:phosphoglycolate phosphatase-like HAD superfamily hydrolase